MKGRKLTLDEVKNLKDGTKVWVEDKDCISRNGVYDLDKIGEMLYSDLYAYDGMLYEFKNYSFEDLEIEVYEWLDMDEIKPSRILYCSSSAHYKMASEICNLRGLDLTDENIEKIIEEFKEKN